MDPHPSPWGNRRNLTILGVKASWKTRGDSPGDLSFLSALPMVGDRHALFLGQNPSLLVLSPFTSHLVKIPNSLIFFVGKYFANWAA